MPRVLVVDDYPAIAEAVATMLRATGCDVAVVNGGEAALDFLKVNLVGLVVLDVSMPSVSGLDVLRSMAEEGRLGATQVLMFSASEEHRDEALRLGAADFILKHDADHLTAAIEKRAH